MKTRIPFALGLLALAAAPLAAQAPFQEQFKFEGLLPNAPTILVNTGSSQFTAISSPYLGGLAPLATPTNYVNNLLIWCVDETHEAFVGQMYEAWITPLADPASQFSHAREGTTAADKNDYEWAAYLAGSMNLTWTGPNAATNEANAVALQDAMWALLDEGANSAAREAAFRNSALAATLGIPPTSNTSFNFDTSPLPTSFNASDWFLITCDPTGNPTCAPGYGQEFLVELPGGTTTNVVPEPGTMTLLGTGLAGVFGMGFRRRKKRNA